MNAPRIVPPDLPPDCRAAAQMLNAGCACVTVDHARLERALAEGGDSLHPGILATRPHLFSDTLVFVADEHLRHMANVVAAVESVVALPAYREAVLAEAPASARHETGAASAFMGYDFHLGAVGPQLIEINTNAGGGLLNTKLLAAQRECCGPIGGLEQFVAEDVERAFVDMFRTEWQSAGPEAARPLRSIAIVDESPDRQYLAPEFELFRRQLVAAGIDTVIADPSEFSLADGRLICRDRVVDLVYNRLTDFGLDEPGNAVLREAWMTDAAVLTPHPRAHALYADKRNLALLSDDAWLTEIGVAEATRQVLRAGIPETRRVRREDAERYWAERRRWFFKPALGFGSRAAYRGDKLTKRVFEEIIAGDYVAQALVAPSERRLHVADNAQDLKLDLRAYSYRGLVQLVAARLYQGQTTNFRTPGGGFASVFSVRCTDSA